MNNRKPSCSGRIAIDIIDDITGSRTRVVEQSNQLQYTWAALAAECIGRGNRDFRLRAMYLEFENVTNPNTAVTVPTYTRDEGLEYYTGLSSSSVRDYLRVPLLYPPTIDITDDMTEIFTEGVTGNRITCVSQSQGTTGVHGKAFNDTVHSKVFGLALVATPQFSDPTQDIVFSRTYLSGSNQQLKQALKSIGISWPVTFE